MVSEGYNFVYSLEEEKNKVEHPSYYTDGKIETWDFIIDKNLNYLLGNAVKYISRAGKKKENGMTNKKKTVEDLSKAIEYIKKQISVLEENNVQK